MQKKFEFLNNIKDFEHPSNDSAACGSCLKWYSKKEVVSWADREKTAICPKCNMDNVVFFNSKDHESLLEDLAKIKLSEN